MKKSKVIVLTQATKPPAAIQQCIAAAGALISVSYSDVQKSADLQKLLATEKPDWVLLDSEFGLLDKKAMVALSKMDEGTLRLHFLENAKDLPKSIKMLQYLDAMKDPGMKIVVFIDKPSDALCAELGRRGASRIYHGLNQISPGQASLFQAISGGKAVVGGLRQIGKALFSSKK